ncbi:sugar transferase [Microbacterium marinilacus]|uniref:sugar transferase n=1 Tax=Microbacterium marinilacus TaxID=415209 RepID=UPI001C8D1EF8|nr:sugar transferase [Microbacterium marinilacus]MBY0689440.1 sugar transferase [Microbacterium marinilacus]
MSQWFDPEPTFKGLMFAKALRARGYSVQVLTGFPNYPGGRLYDGYRIKLFQREKVDGVDILRVPLYPSHDASSLRRVANYLSFALAAAVAALIVRRPAVAYVYHPPATVGIVAQVLKYVRGVPFVYDVQDLWPDTLRATGMVSGSPILGAVGRYMKAVYRAASRVVVLSPGFRRLLAERGVPEGKLEVIPNWTYEPAGARTTAAPPANDEFVVMYAGNVGAAQALEVVVGAARELTGQGVRFDIVGDGLRLADVKRAAEAAGVDNVRFIGRRPAAEMDERLASADALLVHLRTDPLFEITIPSKTQAYLRAGRPILMGVRGDAAQMVEEAAAGVAFEPESASSLADAVRRLQALTPSARERMGASGQAYYAQRLALRVGTARFDEVLSEASLHRPRYLFAKRVLDVLGAGVGLVVGAVPMAIVALLVRWRIGGPVLFVQERPGRNGTPFRMFKFRTMTNAIDTDGALLPDRDRLTALGRILRTTSLDELPELWNVLKGDMSLVGPRPLLIRYTPFFTERERIRLRVRPGITGWAQVNGRNQASWDQRLAHDVWYVENRSFALDMRVIALTFTRVLRSDGVVVDAESIMRNLDDERAGEAVR